MEIGLGMMRLPPNAFWSMTPNEFLAAYDGWCEFEGLRRHSSAAPTRAELHELMARFPDAMG
jgi:uncharacterized phage protein (TIGR02216 family)